MSLCRPGGLELTRYALHKAGLTPGQTLLDIGCGSGDAAAFAQREFSLSATGIDCDREAVRAATEQGVHALVQSADFLEFPSRSFDGVMLECVFSVLDRQEEAIHEAYCMLKPGGALILSDLYVRHPDMVRFRRERAEAMARWRRPRVHEDCEKQETLPSPFCQDGAVVVDSLKALLEELGLSVVLLEDRTGDLKEFLGQIILDYGSVKQYVQAQPGSTLCRCTAPSAGYFLLIARKPL